MPLIQPTLPGRSFDNNAFTLVIAPLYRARFRGRAPFARALAARLGHEAAKTDKRLRNIERGLCRPRLSEVALIAEMLGVDVALLLALAQVIDDSASADAATDVGAVATTAA